MSLCHPTYKRCAIVAVVLIALPSFLTAQTAPTPKPAPMMSNDSFPSVELFIGYQWLNPGGNVPDTNSPPNAVQLPSLSKGIGISAAYNFTSIFL